MEVDKSMDRNEKVTVAWLEVRDAKAVEVGKRHGIVSNHVHPEVEVKSITINESTARQYIEIKADDDFYLGRDRETWYLP